MTERHPKESSIGHAGRLLFQPFGIDQAEDCKWQSARNVSQNGPCFKDLGLYRQWYSGNTVPQSPGAASGSTWQKTRRQKTWLLKSYPESRLGNGIVHGLLSEAHSLQEPDHDTSWHPALFAVGELTDTSNARSVSRAPFLARATGGANNIIQLARLDQEEWRWNDNENVSLHLLGMGDYQPASWEGGIGSIRRIKCVVDYKRYDPTRWLIVQWDSETRVFQPEFGKSPVGLRPGDEEASRIAVNSLFALSKNETGGNPHTDAAFNTNARSKPAQLGLIDEKGYWSIWDVSGIKVKASTKTRIKIHKCGHIEDGVLKQLPYQATGRSDRHTIFWVGGSEDPLYAFEGLDLGEDTTLPQSQGAFPPLERSSTLLLGNSKLIRLLDLKTNVFLPDISFVPRTGSSRILGVQLSPQDPRYFFILTTSRLFVAGLFSTPGLKWDQPAKQSSILLSLPHHRDSSGPNLKLSLAPGPSSKGQIMTLVFIYSTGNSWLDIFHVSIAKHDTDLVKFYHEAISLDVSRNPLQNPLQALQLHPVAVVQQPSKPLDKTACLYVQQQVRFYQLVALDSSLHIVSKLFVSSADSVEKIAAPNLRIHRRTNQLRERKQLIRHLASRFVVPDYLATHENESNPERRLVRRKGQTSAVQPPQRFLKLAYEQLSDAIGGENYDQLMSGDAFNLSPFAAVQYAVQKATTDGRMPATTLLQIIRHFDLPDNINLVGNEWDVQVERLQRIDPSLLLLDLTPSSGKAPEQSGSSLGDVHVKLLKLVANIPEDSGKRTWTTEFRPTVLRKMACDLYLSLCGLIYGKPDLAQAQEAAPEFVSHLEYPDNISIISSRLPQSQASQSTESPATVAEKSQEEDVEEPAMALLRAYTDSGNFVPKKRFELLGQWQIGSDPKDYVFDLDKEKEVTPGMQRKARILARESRKRRRAETLLQMKQEPSLTSTQPVPEVRFSQRTQPVAAFSSQSHIHSDPMTMSQPVAGPFARRPKKRPKRKGGF